MLAASDQVRHMDLSGDVHGALLQIQLHHHLSIHLFFLGVVLHGAGIAFRLIAKEFVVGLVPFHPGNIGLDNFLQFGPGDMWFLLGFGLQHRPRQTFLVVGRGDRPQVVEPP